MIFYHIFHVRKTEESFIISIESKIKAKQNKAGGKHKWSQQTGRKHMSLKSCIAVLAGAEQKVLSKGSKQKLAVYSCFKVFLCQATLVNPLELGGREAHSGSLTLVRAVTQRRLCEK